MPDGRIDVPDIVRNILISLMGSPMIGFLMTIEYRAWIGLTSFVLSILTGITMGIFIFRHKKKYNQKASFGRNL